MTNYTSKEAIERVRHAVEDYSGQVPRGRAADMIETLAAERDAAIERAEAAEAIIAKAEAMVEAAEQSQKDQRAILERNKNDQCNIDQIEDRPMPAAMTHKERKIARHALGLPNRRMTSYRNRYVCPYHPCNTTDTLFSMEARSLAVSMKPRSGKVAFYLTHDGAKAALEPGERLCPEDFPEDT